MRNDSWQNVAMGFGTGIRISKTGGRYKLSATQTHHGMEGRDIVRGATLAEYKSDPIACG